MSDSTPTTTTTSAPTPVVAAQPTAPIVPISSPPLPIAGTTSETTTTTTTTTPNTANLVAIQPPQIQQQPSPPPPQVQPQPQTQPQAQPTTSTPGQATPGEPTPGQPQPQPQPTLGQPEQIGQLAQLTPGQPITIPGQPGQQIILIPAQPGQPIPLGPDGNPLPIMPPTTSATSIAAAAAAAAAMAAAMSSGGQAPATLTPVNLSGPPGQVVPGTPGLPITNVSGVPTVLPPGMTPVYIPGYPPGTVMTHAQFLQIQQAQAAAGGFDPLIGGVAQVPPLNPGDLGPHYSHHHFNTNAEFQAWKDSIQSQHGDYIVSGAVRTLKDGCRSFTLVCAVSGPYRKHRHKQGKSEQQMQSIAARPNRSKPSKKQGKMCTARMRIRHDAKDHVYVKFYPIHNHPWNPNDITHLRQLRLTSSVKTKIEELLKANVPVKQILQTVHHFQMADAIAAGATPEQQLQIKREQLINRTDIKNIQYKLQQQAAVARGEVPPKQASAQKRKMVIWNGPGSATSHIIDPNDPNASAAAAAAAAAQAAQQAQQVNGGSTILPFGTVPMDTSTTTTTPSLPVPGTAAAAVAAAGGGIPSEDPAAKRQKLDYTTIASAAQAVAVAQQAAANAAQHATTGSTPAPPLPPLPIVNLPNMPILPSTIIQPQQQQQQQPPQQPQQAIAHYSCDICETAIDGNRYHCTHCEDYDVCEKCYSIISSEMSQHTQPNHTPSPAYSQLLSNADIKKRDLIATHATGVHVFVLERSTPQPTSVVVKPS